MTKYDLKEIKTQFDEAVVKAFKENNYRESHIFEDVRLFISFCSVCLAAATFGIEKYYGYKFAKQYYPFFIYPYLFLSGLQFFWSKFIQANRLFVGFKTDRHIKVSATTDVPLTENPVAFCKVTIIKDHLVQEKQLCIAVDRIFDIENKLVEDAFKKVFYNFLRETVEKHD
ncbi:signal peptidase subunit Spc2 [Schizosaccharomyces japonicus yFS275]|uniref:Signal peptidase complex subunit 2 n=1 Tax=Schizosaccharomyces japonicus (strain yFS275 / FY16936) TaxID=402676 RepID=B6K1E1_SCHJY|nr:signal peptidase subunit Spc2 [Schizosaccharomyces japonicus yFS275]EEB07762.1 signal peptidase subunit Spc2 [Schizosaccharomyces japonicus yFS275]